MPSMGLAYTNDYTLTDRFKAFYRERAEGGVGLMTIGPILGDALAAPVPSLKLATSDGVETPNV